MSNDITATEWKCNPFIAMFLSLSHIPQALGPPPPSPALLFLHGRSAPGQERDAGCVNWREEKEEGDTATEGLGGLLGERQNFPELPPGSPSDHFSFPFTALFPSFTFTCC